MHAFCTQNPYMSHSTLIFSKPHNRLCVFVICLSVSGLDPGPYPDLCLSSQPAGLQHRPPPRLPTAVLISTTPAPQRRLAASAGASARRNGSLLHPPSCGRTCRAISFASGTESLRGLSAAFRLCRPSKASPLLLWVFPVDSGLQTGGCGQGPDQGRCLWGWLGGSVPSTDFLTWRFVLCCAGCFTGDPGGVPASALSTCAI